MQELTIETQLQAKLNELMMVSLGFNASVIEYASMVIAAGPVKDKQQYKKHVTEFKRIHDTANAAHIKIIEQMEKVVSDDRD